MYRALTVLVLLATACRATTYYVSPHPPCCDDGPSSGSIAAPLCSIEVALARCSSAQPPGEEKLVVLLNGTFQLRDTLRLSAAHSGLTLRADSPGRAILSGGLAVTGWIKKPPSSQFNGADVWVAQLPEGVTGARTPRQLYVDGVRATRASGNASELGNLTSFATPLTAQTPREGGLPGYRVTNTTLAGWRNARDLEFVYTAMTQPWIAPRCRVRSVSADGHTLTMERCLDAIGPARAAAAVGPGIWASSGTGSGSGRWLPSPVPPDPVPCLDLSRAPYPFRE